MGIWVWRSSDRGLEWGKSGGHPQTPQHPTLVPRANAVAQSNPSRVCATQIVYSSPEPGSLMLVTTIITPPTTPAN